MKKITIFFILITSFGFSQKKVSSKFGQINKEELKMTVYEKDSSANAVVLYEHANLYVDTKSDNFDNRTDFYHRIKLFKKEAFDEATVKIVLREKERIKDIKAASYSLNQNGSVQKVFLSSKDIFRNKLDDYWTEISFTIPNIKEGSVIEYVYSVTSPYSIIDDWYFQSDIPKIKSDFSALVLGNYKYNIATTGYQTLQRNDASVKEGCVYLPGIGDGSCLKLLYGMDNIPAFIEEDYMLSKKNFISKLTFELKSFTKVDGSVRRYTRSWKDADKTLRLRFLDGQTSKKNFFKKQLPSETLNEVDELQKATKVFQFIQSHFNWNSRYFTQEKINLRKAFDEKVGSVYAINLALYNSLQAVNIESYPVMLSTRKNGLPTNLFPVVSEFNYVIVKAVINGKTYFLDARDKYLSFGEVSFECLNGNVRVLDFDKGSYWERIRAKQISSSGTRLSLTLTEENAFEGAMTITSKGYRAVSKRKKLDAKSEDQYLEDIESENPYLEIEKYTPVNRDDLDKALQEKFEVRFFDDSNQYTYQRINPFFEDRISVNPFKLKERKYPVDFGAPFSYSYFLRLTIPDSYEVISIPESMQASLPNNGGSLLLKTGVADGQINIFMRYVISKKRYQSQEYQDLKEFFQKIINIQKSFIEVKSK